MEKSELEQHVIQLAQHHKVFVIYRGRGIAYPRQRRITIPHVRGQVTYLVALHELGHVVGPQSRLRLSQEMEAWQWALNNSLVEPTAATYRAIQRSLDHYVNRANRWRSMKIPDDYIDFRNRIAALAKG